MNVRASGLVAAILIATLGLSIPAAATDGWDGNWGEPPADPAPAPGTGPAPSGYLWWTIRAGTHPDTGEPCWELAATREDTPPDDYFTREAAEERLAIWDVSGVAYEACPATISPAALALELWVSLAPQGVSDIEVAPGWALAGLGTYLVFDGPGPISAQTTGGGVTIAIEAWPEYVIDWGDGSAPVRTSSTGVPYPGGEGELRHVYTHVGTPIITVTTEWQARFTAPGIEQALPGRTVVATEELEVRERRAVRTR